MNVEREDYFTREGRLRAGDAAVALIVVDHCDYLLQLRDQKPGIFYPGHWGLFGGGLDQGETADVALRRELSEELGFSIGDVAYFTELSFDFARHGGGRHIRRVFEIQVKSADVSQMSLGEGRDMRIFSGREILSACRVTPYDAFAIWMHFTQSTYGCPRG